MRYANLPRRLLAVTLAILMLTGIAGAGYAADASIPSAYSLVLTRTLYQGRTGADVRAVQTILKELGYYTGSIDGIYGSKTTAAVKAFQTRNGVAADGQVGNATFQRMISPTAIRNGASSGSGESARSYLRYGDTGSAVLEMQRALKALGYYDGPLSGNFLNQTLTAVRNFQSRNGLTVDGLAGRITLSLLYSGKAKPYYYQPTQPPVVRPTPTPTPAAQRTLRLGMSGDDVAAVQSRLYQLGYYGSRVNGYYDQTTQNAVRSFQSRNGLYVDGVVGPQTWQRLFSSSANPNYQPTRTATWTPVTPSPSPRPTPAAQRTLRYGMSGDDVAAVQSRLYQLGYYGGSTINGYFDQATLDAVKWFQSRNNLYADGVVGPQSWQRMFSSSANPNVWPITPTVPPVYPSQPPTWQPTWQPSQQPPTSRPSRQPGQRPGGRPDGRPTQEPTSPPVTYVPTSEPTTTASPAPTSTSSSAPSEPPALTAPTVTVNDYILTITPVAGAYSYYIDLTVTDTATGGYLANKAIAVSNTSIDLRSIPEMGVYSPGKTLYWSVVARDSDNVAGPPSTGSKAM
ncbi:MAG: peptidoglycan-binding protein [Oscillospiraceae bacterium]|nr:peptidoglycan-binding protein [Oscillospiraceae bacterium]